MEYQIRLAKEADAKAVHDIYGAYVPLDYVTFTVENPDIESYTNNRLNEGKDLRKDSTDI